MWWNRKPAWTQANTPAELLVCTTSPVSAAIDAVCEITGIPVNDLCNFVVIGLRHSDHTMCIKAPEDQPEVARLLQFALDAVERDQRG